MTALAVSIDWDFFIFHGGHLDRVDTVDPSTGRTRQVPGVAMYDWGHSEIWSASVQVALVMSRFVSFARCGLDLQAEHTVREDRGCEDPRRFADRLHAQLGRTPTLWRADTHAHAYHRFALHAADAGPLHIVSFDAHHDLCYSPEQAEQERANGHFTCGSWLLHLLDGGYAERATIVYPDWLGLAEWKPSQRLSHVRQLAESGRVAAMTYSQWLAGAYRPGESPGVAFACRSGAWTPPWLDDDFDRFCSYLTDDVADAEPVESRGWNRDAALEHVRAASQWDVRASSSS